MDTFIYKIYLFYEKIVINYTTQDSNNIKLLDRNLVLSSLEGTIAPPIDIVFLIKEFWDK